MKNSGGDGVDRVVFYEKTGCIGNARQKALLRAQGIRLDVRDLLSERWTSEGLRAFFGHRPVTEWFNLSAPAVKSGEVRIHECGETEALLLMLADPLLIRRPLLRIDDICQSGFDGGPVLDLLGISLDPDEDLQSCPVDGSPGDDALSPCGELI